MARKVLIVDDDPVLRAIAAEALSRGDFAHRTAVDGKQALEMLAAGPFDLVLLDMLMPRMDGLEVLPHIRSRWPLTPVIAMSAGASGVGRDLMLETARLMGASAVLAKPFSQPVLLDTVYAVLQTLSRGDQDLVAARRSA